MRTLPLLLAFLPILTGADPGAGQAPVPRGSFSFRSVLEDPPSLSVQEPVIAGASVTVSGGDSRRPRLPFVVDWGDDEREEAFFPLRHTYGDTTRDYTVTVTARYDSGEAVETIRVRFLSVHWAFERGPDVPRRVHVANEPIALATTLPGYEPPDGLQGLADEDLAAPRAAWEYLLDVGHHLQLDFCNGDVRDSGDPRIMVLGHPGFGGAYALWFTRPAAIAADPAYLGSLSGLSSMYHELGHDLTLNTPARFRLGGHTDGPMSTIVSESLAQILQHATAWELLNHPGRYGVGEELGDGLRRSALAAFAITSRAYRDYLAQGCPFSTCQAEGEDGDRTFGTFMSLAYVFVEQAEQRGAFRAPLQRTMALLQTFREEDRARYQERTNDAFRATLMVAALSHGFERDLRERFRGLRFDLDDAVFDELQARMAAR